MSFFDMKTVFFSYAVSNAIGTGFIARLWLQNRRRFAGLDWWLACFAAHTVSMLLVIVRGAVPDWVSMIVSNVLLVGGTLLLYIGLERFVAQRGSQIHNYALLAMFTVIQAYFVFIRPNLAAREINISVGLLAICFQCAWLMLRRVSAEMRPITTGVGLTAVAYSVVSVIRIFVDVVAPPGHDFFKESGLYDTLLILTYQMLSIVLIFSLSLMINRRLLADLGRDLAARQQAEVALRASEEKFAKAFEASPDAILITRLNDGNIIEVNESFCRLSGYSRAEALGHSTLALNLWADPQDRNKFTAALQKNHSIRNHTYDFRVKSGTILRGLFAGEMIRLEEEIHLLTIVDDITARTQTEAILRLRLQLLEFAATHTLEALMEKALDEIEALTGSSIGFYHFVEEDQETLTLQTWSTRTKQEFCKAEGQGMHYGVEQAGVWVDCVHQRKPVIHNDYAALPHRKGMPPGHATLIRELVVPTMREGHIVSILGVGNKAVDYDERDVEWVAYVADVIWSIVERKRTEEQLQTYQRRLEAQNLELRKLSLAIEQSGNAILITDSQGVIEYVNPSFEETAGYTRQEVLGQNPRFLKSGEQDTKFYRKLWDTISGGQIWRGEFHNRRKDGTLYWESTTIAPIQDDTGQIIHYIAIKEDTTARKEAEEALHEKTEELDRFFSLALDLLCIADTEGYFHRLNQAWEKALGYSLADMEGHRFLDFVHPDDKPATLAAVGELAAGQEVARFVNRYRCKDDSYRWIEWRSTSYGNLIYAAARDITEHIQAEGALRQAKEAAEAAQRAAEAANRAKSAFLSNISHELRTPLNAVMGFSELMGNDPNLTPQQKENLDIIGRSGEHLLALINAVLDLSKIEAGRSELQPEVFDLHEMLLGLGEMFSLQARQKGLTLVFDFAPDVPQYIYADQQKLRQILINLLSNAVKFTEKGGIMMKVESREAPPQSPPAIQLHFEIKDTGIGIAPEEMDKVFEAFVQTGSGQRSQQGTGLGLPISREYVRLMGGDLTVQSGTGVGSIFSFDIHTEIIKAMLTNAHPTYQMVGLKPGQPTYRILIAEDDEASRVLLVKFLVPLGFEVEEARNGAEAVTRWEAWQPHLIFMDMRMPVMDGRQATQAIKSKIANQHSKINTVIVALTASAFEGEQANFLNAGCDDFVRKPFREATLIEILTRHLKVHFVYAPMNGHKTSASETQNEPPNGKKIKTQLIMLNPQWTATMQKATVEGDLKQMEALMGEIREQAPELAGQLTRLLYNFEHEEILKLLKT